MANSRISIDRLFSNSDKNDIAFYSDCVKELSNILIDFSIVDGWFTNEVDLNKLNNDKSDYIFLIKLNNQNIGIIHLFRIDDLSIDDSVMLWDIFLNKEYRNKGYSKIAIDLAYAVVKKEHKNINKISLHVLANNINARKAYAKMGFNEFSITMIKDM